MRGMREFEWQLLIKSYSMAIGSRGLIHLQVTHNASPVTPLTIGGTVLKDSDDLDILGVTLDSKMTLENHLHSVSRAASQMLGILFKSWRVFHGRLLLCRCFRGFVLQF